MPSGTLFAIGVLASWAAIIFGLKMVSQLFFIGTRQLDSDPRRTRSELTTNSILTAVCAVIGAALTRPFASGSFKLPVVWFVMPWTAWLGAGCAALLVARLIQSTTAISGGERAEKLKAAGGLGLAVLVFTGLYWYDPTNKITILQGGIPFSLMTAVGVVFMAVAAVGAMVVTAHSANARGLGKTIITQLALLAGSVVFGVPFLFLLVTSFKEDKDMSSPNGIVWIPKVTETVPYLSPDKAKKHYETIFEGKTVEGLEIGEENGKVKIDIFKPISIRGTTFLAPRTALKEVPVMAKVYTAKIGNETITGFESDSLADGSRVLQVMEPLAKKGTSVTVTPDKTEAVRHVGLRTENYSEALSYLPVETLNGLVYVKNTLILVVMNVVGTILGSSIVAYAFSRMKFPGKEKMFSILLATMMLPGAITLLPQFLIFRTLGWIDTLYPLWVPAFFGSAFNIFLLRQFFSQIPMELEDAAKIDGCSYLKTFWSIMIPQIKPALAVIAIWTFMGAWNNFMGPLIYINSPENMPLSYSLALFKGDRSGEPGLLMAFSTLTVIPVIALFAFAQRYFIEGVTLSGLGGR